MAPSVMSLSRPTWLPAVPPRAFVKRRPRPRTRSFAAFTPTVATTLQANTMMANGSGVTSSVGTKKIKQPPHPRAR
ncbi:hypothetical protein SPRG_17923 [Saprolegnia parasitica CBS 223.65]|uniref:Uncharacterized protein n=1 Tax=Saprolegnia parasitica (strain CBS 223.65) TaxID=695850 RepID=A0A067BII6_SAPPC|nr:hypothetical protein SPRG_17923 [Saprolegnia parasitica CBS 223.65]KDO16565.1 hypothetical protein SPRG_17923 [Saprolegnia parasitica CBS 223.65]|eukprot:XP_012212728.1 hypothetical protein SPRG_17923 [Saprolegnia parasitica CBS 223.65]